MFKFQIGFSEDNETARIVTKNKLEEIIDGLFLELKDGESLLVLVGKTETSIFLETREKRLFLREKFSNVGFKTRGARHLSEVLRGLANNVDLDNYEPVFKAIAGDDKSFEAAARVAIEELDQQIKEHRAEGNNLAEIMRLEEERDFARENLSNMESGKVAYLMCYLS